jgi:hypothetical protein
VSYPDPDHDDEDRLAALPAILLMLSPLIFVALIALAGSCK